MPTPVLVHLMPTRLYLLCPGCDMPVDPERATKRPYCTDPACVREYAEPLLIRAIGVHKSIPQFVLASDERGKELVGAGRRRA